MCNEDVTEEVAETLEWMIAGLNYRREQTGMDSAPFSPEMKKAIQQLAALRTGTIRCMRSS